MNNLRQRINSDQLMGDNYGTIYLGATDMLQQSASGSVWNLYEMPTNKEIVDSWQFSPSAVEFVGRGIVMPDDWDGGPLKAKFYGHGTGATSGETIIWGIQSCSVSGHEYLDKPFTTGVVASSIYTATKVVEISNPTPLFYVNNSNSNIDGVVFFRIYRRGDIDNHTGYAMLLGVKIQYRKFNSRASSW